MQHELLVGSLDDEDFPELFVIEGARGRIAVNMRKMLLDAGDHPSHITPSHTG